MLPTQPGAMLIADSTMGSVYRVNLWTGEHEVAIGDGLLGPRESSVVPQGVTSTCVQQDERSKKWYFYFTNAFGRPTLGRVPLESDGSASGPGEIIVGHAPGDVGAHGFAIDRSGDFWIATDLARGVLHADAEGQAHIPMELAGRTALTAANAVALGRTRRDVDTLYVATREQVTSPGHVDTAKIVAVDILRLLARED